MAIYVVAHADLGYAIAAVDSLDRALAAAWVEAHEVWQETAESDEEAARGLKWTMTTYENMPDHLELSVRPPWRHSGNDLAAYTITVLDGDYPAISQGATP